MRLSVSGEDDSDPGAVEIMLTGEGSGAVVRITATESSLLVISPHETKSVSALIIQNKK
jgi:hypothetical protein